MYDFRFAELKKDPGIPNLYPFKEQLLKQAEERKQRAAEEREKQKMERQREHDRRRSLKGMQKDAVQRAEEFEKEVCMYTLPCTILCNCSTLPCAIATCIL